MSADFLFGVVLALLATIGFLCYHIYRLDRENTKLLYKVRELQDRIDNEAIYKAYDALVAHRLAHPTK